MRSWPSARVRPPACAPCHSGLAMFLARSAGLACPPPTRCSAAFLACAVSSALGSAHPSPPACLSSGSNSALQSPQPSTTGGLMKTPLLRSQPCVRMQQGRTLGQRLGQHPLLQGEGVEPVNASRQKGERTPVTMVLGTSKICSRSCRTCSHWPAQASSTVSNVKKI